VGVTISDDRLLAVLDDVGLEAVVERVGGLDVEQRDWGHILSLGEQQSLAFARLLLAEPKFAFLDEATSALDDSRARRLYDLLARTSTTFLSVGTGRGLIEYHDLLLQLRGDGTWRVTTLVQEPFPAEWNSHPSDLLEVSEKTGVPEVA
jgi:putative ATP-binding cassette transporter